MPVQRRLNPASVADERRSIEPILRTQRRDGSGIDLAIQPQLVEEVSGCRFEQEKTEEGDAKEEYRGANRAFEEDTHGVGSKRPVRYTGPDNRTSGPTADA